MNERLSMLAQRACDVGDRWERLGYHKVAEWWWTYCNRLLVKATK